MDKSETLLPLGSNSRETLKCQGRQNLWNRSNLHCEVWHKSSVRGSAAVAEDNFLPVTTLSKEKKESPRKPLSICLGKTRIDLLSFLRVQAKTSCTLYRPTGHRQTVEINNRMHPPKAILFQHFLSQL